MSLIEKTAIVYSGATRKTGEVLAVELGIDGYDDVNKLPENKSQIIYWGCKNKKEPNKVFNKVLNPIKNIVANRNKMNALTTMSEAGVKVPKFCDTAPCIGRTKFHQGGKGFWLCVTKNHRQMAEEQGADYFIDFIDVKTEYRVHVAGDKVIKCVYKSPKEGEKLFDSHKNDIMTKFEASCKKNNHDMDDGQKAILNMVADFLAAKKKTVDFIKKSNIDYTFKEINDVLPGVTSEAIKAVKAMGLDFGAVDIVVDVNDNVFVLEVNSGPGLEGSTLKVYTDYFKTTLLTEAPEVPIVKNEDKVEILKQPKTENGKITKKEIKKEAFEILLALLEDATTDEDLKAIKLMKQKLVNMINN